MTSEFAAARVNLARALARRLAPITPIDSWTEEHLAAYIEQRVEWIFADGLEVDIPLEATLVVQQTGRSRSCKRMSER